jgi:hypothetical protein
MAVFIVVIAGSFLQILSELPRYQNDLERTLVLNNQSLSIPGVDLASLTVQDLIQAFSASAAGMLRGISNLVVNFVLILPPPSFLFSSHGFSSAADVH